MLKKIKIMNRFKTRGLNVYQLSDDRDIIEVKHYITGTYYMITDKNEGLFMSNDDIKEKYGECEHLDFNKVTIIVNQQMGAGYILGRTNEVVKL